MQPQAFLGLRRGGPPEPETWRYQSKGNVVERVTKYRTRREVVAICTSEKMATEIAKAMEARPERDLADEADD